jgi:hypothetical protein
VFIRISLIYTAVKLYLFVRRSLQSSSVYVHVVLYGLIVIVNFFFVCFDAECFVFQSAIKKLKIKIHRTIILPLVFYGCETWSLTLREERRLRVFENRMLRRIFGPKRDEVTGEWRKLRNEDFHDLYPHPLLCG